MKLGTGDTWIFSPLKVAGLLVTIGRYVNESKRFRPLQAGRFYRFEHIVPNGSGKAVAKSRALVDIRKLDHNHPGRIYIEVNPEAKRWLRTARGP